jgi:hypothetical protein
VDARNEKLPFLVKKKLRLAAEANLRNAWLQDLGRPASAEARLDALTIEPTLEADRVRFAILGDPGEGDKSQWVVVRPFLARHAKNPPYSFAFILSDVIYPAGDSTDYPRKFYGPYQRFDRPIFAVPGNHDWDDGSLTGFMTHLAVGADGSRVNDAGPNVVAYLMTIDKWWRVWRGAEPSSSQDEGVRNALRARDARRLAPDVAYPVGQPGSYFRMRAGRVWLIGIDTGMTGSVDHDQAEWLLKASSVRGPKILLTGKPLVVNGHDRTNDINWNTGAPEATQFASVKDIVDKAEHGYVVAIGGDIHNYQRYEENGIEYVVAGGSGAFLSSTELIGVDEGTQEREPVQLYPTRALSLVHFELGVANRMLSTRLLPGLAAMSAALIALLFFLPRGRITDLGSAFEALALGFLFALSALVLRPLQNVAAGEGGEPAGQAHQKVPTVLRIIAGIGLFGLLYVYARMNGWQYRLLLSGLAVAVIAVAVGRLYQLSKNWQPTLVVGVGLFVPFAVSVGLSIWVGALTDSARYAAGYLGALVVLGMGAAAVARKISAPEGKTKRERRPYAATFLAAAVWLGLMLVLAASGALTTLGDMTYKQWAFVLLSACTVLATGLLAHPPSGPHRLVVSLITVGVVGTGLVLLFGWSWHQTGTERDQLREGLFESVAVLLVAFGAAAAALVYYAHRVAGKVATPEAAASRMAAFDSGELSVDAERHEFIGAILRAIRASELIGPIFENEEPPMLKSFLEVEVTRDKVEFTAFRASGFEAEAEAPVAVDRFEVELPPT